MERSLKITCSNTDDLRLYQEMFEQLKRQQRQLLITMFSRKNNQKQMRLGNERLELNQSQPLCLRLTLRNFDYTQFSPYALTLEPHPRIRCDSTVLPFIGPVICPWRLWDIRALGG